ncbi:hypothetical protein Tco_1434958 [Tanacetum coccineum]
MHFFLTSMSVVYVLSIQIPDDGGHDATVEQIRKRSKWKNDDYVCRDAQRTAPTTPLYAAPLPQNLNTPLASTTAELQAPTPRYSSTDPLNTASASGYADEQEQQEDDMIMMHCGMTISLLIRLALHQRNRLNPPIVHSTLPTCTHFIKHILESINGQKIIVGPLECDIWFIKLN